MDRRFEATHDVDHQVQPSELETVVEGQFRGAGVVVHAYSADSPLCASLDLFLEGKAASYMGTR